MGKMNDKAQELVAVPADLPVDHMSQNQIAVVEKITAQNLSLVLANAEALVQFHERIRPIVLKVTRAHHWTILGDKPYLMDAGIDNVCGVVGVSITDVKIETEARTDQSGRLDFYYTATGKIHFNGINYENVGVSSTKDKFFADRTRKADDPAGNWKKNDKYKLTVDEIELPNVKKKSVTNLKHRLMMMVFHLDPTQDELNAHFKNHGGGEVKKVTYGTGSKGGSSDTAEEKKLRVTLGNVINRIADNKGAAPQDILVELTTFPKKDGGIFEGYTELARVSVKMLKGTITKAEKMFKELPAGREPGQD